MNGDLIELRNVAKCFAGGARALDEVSLTVRENEFFTLLGPSGCGKTTLLRIIAGFEFPDSGGVFLDGEDIAAAPPEKRPVNTVFQNYALFPHMTVLENAAFGLEMRGKSREDARREAQKILDVVALGDFAARRPSQLSGGQQQRVALARALANHPRVLLLDEPLSALDLKLRKAMRAELKRLQRETAITFIFCHARPGGGAGNVRPRRGDERRENLCKSARRRKFMNFPPIVLSPILSARRICCAGARNQLTAKMRA